ncbi:ABC transporter [Chloropicon primus]|uniref:ABC transporter n=1 Tax=Chloropicon primus TaxID=1764295 RepID=A0A5B8MTL5_9CHLO|nr:ABC transporter [Chloropicon primus]UPR02890.1 ABC transporter [Chloropicon primus]|mmetsp:Transcript_8814/g.25164  ORF Transcript_8814/g.25164 Transcript_8814/m.25164 type:complete len:1196 (-) Transcript_8814:207-3794(-)|eukprot:QDZ23677.1 ABC transporter [Chloropicon primus]
MGCGVPGGFRRRWSRAMSRRFVGFVFVLFVLGLVGLGFEEKTCYAQIDIGTVLQQVNPQDTLGAVCEDEKFKVVLKSICEPGGAVAKAIRGATVAKIPEEALTLEEATTGESGAASLPELAEGRSVQEVREGGQCLVDVGSLKLVRTNDLRLRSVGRNTEVRGVKNEFVESWKESITKEVAQFITTLQGDDPSSSSNATKTDDDMSVYTVFSESELICSEGLQCVVTDAADLAAGGQLSGTCKKCKFGSYCPAGVVNDESGALKFTPSVANQCPPGYFCETPSSIKNCPAGLFCPSGSAKPLDCNDLGFEMKHWGTEFSARLEGNYCPPNSQEPWTLCPGGYYCPNATVAIVCPKGHYCPAMTKEPRKCPFLSVCNEGSSAPSISWMALVGVLALGVVVYGTSFLIIWRSKKACEGDSEDEELTLFNDKVIKTICSVVLPRYKAREIADICKMGTLSVVSDPLRLDICDLTVKFKNRVILSSVNFHFPNGTLNAIFGPSGAGKTTLIKSMLGKLSYNLDVAGKVSFTKCTSNEEIKVYSNSRTCLRKTLDFFETSAARKKVISNKVGYVPQDNVVYPNLTVNENILYSVKLRNKFVASRKALTDQILNLLGLLNAKNTIVGTPERGGISGGECRRVSIGLELAGCPLCLVLDEPTTGLDAVSADRVLKCLNFLTASGMTIIASIHQPKSSIFHLFDQIHVLMKGGYVVYTGPKNYVTRYFDHLGFVMPELENPADFIIDIVSGLVNCKSKPSFTTEELAEMWVNNKQMLQHYSSDPSRYGEGSSESSFVDMDAKNQEKAMDEEAKLLLDLSLPDLHKELSRNQELNSGKHAYSLSIDELKGLVIHICAATCHLKYFDTVDECIRHVSNRIRSCLSPERNRPSGDISAGDQEPEPQSYSRLTSLFSFKSFSWSFKSALSLKSFDTDGDSSCTCNLAHYLKRQLQVACVLYSKDILGWVRLLGLKTVDMVITAVFAIILGFNQGQGNMEVKDILYMSMLINLYVGMLSVVWSITLTLERLKSAEREAGGSISTGLVYTSAKMADLIDHILRPTVFSLLFYFISLPRQSFFDFYVVVLGVSLSCSGLGDFVSVIFPENLATVMGLIIAFLFGGILNGFSPPLSDLPSEWIVFPSYARWGVEAMSLSEFKEYNDWRTITGMQHIGYSFDNYTNGVLFLYISALVLRVAAYPLFRKRALA